MRNANQIDNILLELGRIWKRHPHLRLGQLISNEYDEFKLYYVEDDQLIAGLKRAYIKDTVNESEEFWEKSSDLWDKEE